MREQPGRNCMTWSLAVAGAAVLLAACATHRGVLKRRPQGSPFPWDGLSSPGYRLSLCWVSYWNLDSSGPCCIPSACSAGSCRGLPTDHRLCAHKGPLTPLLTLVLPNSSPAPTLASESCHAGCLWHRQWQEGWGFLPSFSL